MFISTTVGDITKIVLNIVKEFDIDKKLQWGGGKEVNLNNEIYKIKNSQQVKKKRLFYSKIRLMKVSNCWTLSNTI